MHNANETIFDFNFNSDPSLWKIVDDVVMGGKSNGNFKINNNGHGEFYGDISLENNGGFSSLRYRFSFKNINTFNSICLLIKGDGKKYQFRVKDESSNKYSYIANFSTKKDWETIVIPLSEMFPAFRGSKLEMNNFSSNQIEEIAFLIGNKKEESFKLQIDKIYLK